VNPSDVIKYPTMTERSVYMIENENKLIFIVDRRATKKEIATAVKAKFEALKITGVEIAQVNTLIDRKGNKKAFVRFTDTVKASDLAISLKLL